MYQMDFELVGFDFDREEGEDGHTETLLKGTVSGSPGMTLELLETWVNFIYQTYQVAPNKMVMLTHSDSEGVMAIIKFLPGGHISLSLLDGIEEDGEE